MDWAIGKGYAGLYQTVNKNQQAKEELGTLQMLDQTMKADRAEKEQNDLKEAAYQEQISKFADTLLAPDRDRINKKAGVLSSMIREHIKANGNDMGRFWANGGHKIMSEYKSSVVNSEESGTYIENKKNMERILDMQQKGFGHLIAPTDMNNLDNYRKNGEGKITFSGMLNQIEMPDLNSFDYDKTIPVENILNNGQNYVKFLGNYKLTYPTASFPPSEQELKSFVALSHGNIKGSNYQRDLAYQTQADNQAYRKATLDQGDKQWNLDYLLRKSSQEFNQELQYDQNEQNKYAAGINSQYGTKSNVVDTSGMTKEQIKELEDNQGTIAYQIENMNESVESEVPNVESINDQVWEKYGKQVFGKDSFDRFEIFSKNYEENGSGGNFWDTDSKIGRGVKNVMLNAFAPRGSKMIFNGAEAESAAKVMSGFKYDETKGGFKMDLKQMRDSYTAEGIKIENLKTDISEKGVIASTYGEDVADRIWKPLGVVGTFVGKDQSGKETIIMDVRGSKGRGTKDDKKTIEYNKRIKTNEKPVPRLMMAMESEFGERTYVPITGTARLTELTKWVGADGQKVHQARVQANKSAQGTISKMKKDQQNVQTIYSQLKENEATQMIQHAQMIPGANNTGNKFGGLSTSFYVIANSLSGGKTSNGEMVKQGAFLKLIEEVNSNPQNAKELRTLVQDASTTDRKIIKFFEDKGYISPENAKSWEQTLNFIKTKN